MELEIALTLLLLIVLSVLATVDMAFGQLSDVGLRRLTGENGEKPERPSKVFLQQVLENRPRFGFALSAMIQILLVVVAVLITNISLNLFPNPRMVLIGVTIHGAEFLEVDKPRPVILYELVKGWLTGTEPELGTMHRVGKAGA